MINNFLLQKNMNIRRFDSMAFKIWSLSGVSKDFKVTLLLPEDYRLESSGEGLYFSI